MLALHHTLHRYDVQKSDKTTYELDQQHAQVVTTTSQIRMTCIHRTLVNGCGSFKERTRPCWISLGIQCDAGLEGLLASVSTDNDARRNQSKRKMQVLSVVYIKHDDEKS